MFPRASRFEFVSDRYTGREPAIGCDGLVPGAALDLTHWQGNHTPMEFKADTSTEIALKFVSSNESLKWSGAVVVNNHFDTDGVLSAAALLNPQLAESRRGLLVAAAEAGDFDEWPGQDQGLWLDAAIRALGARAANDAEAYAQVLPQVQELTSTLADRSDLWGAEWQQLQAACTALDAGELRAEHFRSLGIMWHAPGRAEAPGPILSRCFLPGARRYLLAFDLGKGSFLYRYERPRYAWADTVVRPLCPAPDTAALAAALGSPWTDHDVPGMTGLVQTGEPIRAEPHAVAARLAQLDPA